MGEWHGSKLHTPAYSHHIRPDRKRVLSFLPHCRWSLSFVWLRKVELFECIGERWWWWYCLLLLFLPLFDFKSQTRQTKLIIVVVTSKCIVVVKKGCCNLWPLNFVVLNSTHVSFFSSFFAVCILLLQWWYWGCWIAGWLVMMMLLLLCCYYIYPDPRHFRFAGWFLCSSPLHSLSLTNHPFYCFAI